MIKEELTHIQQIIRGTGLSTPEFSNRFGFTHAGTTSPYARVSQWNSGISNPPEYLCKWLERAIEMDLTITEQTKLSVPELIKKSGLSKAALARLYSIPQITVMTWSSGKKEPPDYIRTYLSIFLSIDLAKKLKNKEDAPGEPGELSEVLDQQSIDTKELAEQHALSTDKPDLLEVLKRHNITVRQLGKLYGIPEPTIANWLYQGHRPADWVVNMIDKLLTDEEQKAKQ